MVKYGVYLVRKFFKDKIKNQTEKENLQFNIDPFLSIGLFTLYKNIILQNPLDYSIIYEIFWTLINITNYPSCDLNNPFSYFSLLFTDDYLNIYNSIVTNDSSPKEIICILYQLLHNLIYDSETNRAIIKKTSFITNSVSLITNKNLSNNSVTGEIFRFLSNMTKDYQNISINEANYYFTFFQAPITMSSVYEDKITMNSILALSYLSHINSSAFLINFVVSNITKNLINYLQRNLNVEEEINIYILKIITNLLMCQNDLIVKNIYENGIIDIYSNYLRLLQNDYSSNSKIIRKEIVISIGNLAMFDGNIAANILTSNDIFTILLSFCDAGDFSLRKISICALYYLFDYINDEVIQKSSLILSMLINHLKIEINNEILVYLLETSCSILQTEKRTSNGEIIKNYFLSNGIDDIIQREEIQKTEIGNKLKSILYSN